MSTAAGRYDPCVTSSCSNCSASVTTRLTGMKSYRLLRSTLSASVSSPPSSPRTVKTGETRGATSDASSLQGKRRHQFNKSPDKLYSQFYQLLQCLIAETKTLPVMYMFSSYCPDSSARYVDGRYGPHGRGKKINDGHQVCFHNVSQIS